MKQLLRLLPILALALLSGCATLTEDSMTPLAISFSDGSQGQITLQNKRGVWKTNVPSTVSIRKSDDGLKYEAYTKDGRKAVGMIPSEMGAKIVASAVFIDFGITDAITDKHRKYPVSYVIPIDPIESAIASEPARTTSHRTPADRLSELTRLRNAGLITDEEHDKRKKEILDSL